MPTSVRYLSVPFFHSNSLFLFFNWLEKQVIWRALPYYKKEVAASANLVVATMTEQEWVYYVASFGINPVSVFRATSMPDHAQRRPEVIHTCRWSYPRIPGFYSSPFWYMKKWFQKEVRYRAVIKHFALVRHTWTGVVKCQFDYETSFYCAETKTWKLV